MQIGKLDQLINIQTLVETNVSGEVQRSYTSLATDVPAHVVSSKGKEAIEGARMNARDMIRVMLRFRDDITTRDMIQWEGQNYNIHAVDRTQRRIGELWLTAEAVSFT